MNTSVQTPAVMRMAGDGVAACYPLPVDGPLQWQRTPDGYSTELALPVLHDGCIVIPSFSLIDGDHYGFQFVMHSAVRADGCPLTPIHLSRSTTARDGTPDGVPESAITSHIDCWHVHRSIGSPRLRLVVHCAQRPVRYLLTVNIRARNLTGSAGSRNGRKLYVSPLSQMTAAPDIRRHICSPTATAMVLGFHGKAAPLAHVAAACREPHSGLYGSWPLAVYTASRAGLIGAVEAFTDLDQAASLLDLGLPVVASIRFAAGALAGAPLDATAGHLVVLTGIETHRVSVNDPAAEDTATVARWYDRREFTAAWLDHRGAGYLMVPL